MSIPIIFPNMDFKEKLEKAMMINFFQNYLPGQGYPELPCYILIRKENAVHE